MSIELDPSELPITPTLCLVCASPGWALGWVGQAAALMVQPWAAGAPPQACPLDLWAEGLQLALREHLGSAPTLQLCWGPVPADQRPAWWPDGARRLKPWRQLASQQGLGWQGAHRMAAPAGLAELWDTAQSVPGRAGQWLPTGGWSDRLARHPGRVSAASALICLGLHAALQWGLHPWLQAQHALTWARLDQERDQERQRLAREREQSRQAEQSTRGRLWAQGQARARAPLDNLVEVLRTTDSMAQAQFWTGLRYSDGVWTLQGVAGHEADVQTWLQGVMARWAPQTVQAGPSTWPAEPEWGWPAWRFEWRWSLPESTSRAGSP